MEELMLQKIIKLKMEKYLYQKQIHVLEMVIFLMVGIQKMDQIGHLMLLRLILIVKNIQIIR